MRARQIDIGFGDAVTPGASDVDYPSLLGFPSPSLRAYPVETVVAEKLEALVSLGMRNSRMKDFFDLWVIAKTFAFDCPTLATAVAATFEHRGTAPPQGTPVALTKTFSNDAGKQSQWRAFLSRTRIAVAPEPLPDLIACIAEFVSPLTKAEAAASMSGMIWQPGGPWVAEKN